MINNQKMSKGITLIALVVTIIVLLILAGISITMLSGNNGIIQRATEAKTNSGIAEEKDTLETAVLRTMQKDKYGDVSVDRLRSELENIAEVELIRKIIVVTFPSRKKL